MSNPHYIQCTKHGTCLSDCVHSCNTKKPRHRPFNRATDAEMDTIMLNVGKKTTSYWPHSFSLNHPKAIKAQDRGRATKVKLPCPFKVGDWVSVHEWARSLRSPEPGLLNKSHRVRITKVIQGKGKWGSGFGIVFEGLDKFSPYIEGLDSAWATKLNDTYNKGR